MFDSWVLLVSMGAKKHDACDEAYPMMHRYDVYTRCMLGQTSMTSHDGKDEGTVAGSSC